MSPSEKDQFFVDLINTLKDISSLNDKRDVINLHKESISQISTEIDLMYSNKKFGMTVEIFEKLCEGTSNEAPYDDFISILSSNGKPNEISNDIKTLISSRGSPVEGLEIIKAILSKGPKIGSGPSLFTEFITSKLIFVPTLAQDLSKKPKKVSEFIKNHRTLISPKIDGRRATITIVDNKVVSILSRSGKETAACEALKYELERLNLGTIILDGELGFQNTKPDEMFDRIGEYNRKDHTVEDALFMVFDAVADGNYEERMDLFLSKGINSKFLEVVNQVEIDSIETFFLLYETIMSRGYEGVMLRDGDSPYIEGRTSALQKYKPVFDEEFIVLEAIEGSKLFVSERETLACISYLKVKSVTEGIECHVGSGIKETERLEWLKDPSLIVGKIITVQYQNKTKTEHGTSFRFPVFKGIRGDV